MFHFHSSNSSSNQPNSSASLATRSVRLSSVWKTVLRWIPRPQRWVYIGWFGGIQIVTRSEKL